jgi:hypothetical protein
MPQCRYNCSKPGLLVRSAARTAHEVSLDMRTAVSTRGSVSDSGIGRPGAG